MPILKPKSVYTRLLLVGLLCATALILVLQPNKAFGKYFDRVGEIGRNEKLVSQFVWQMMERNHLSRRSVDDNISKRAFDKYIQSLDPTKAYFRKLDIKEFSTWKTQLDDQLKNSDYSPAFQIFERFVQRVDQQTELAIELVDEDHDFSVDEEMIVDPELADYAQDDAEASEVCRKRIKYNLLALRGNGDEQPDATKPDPKKTVTKSVSFVRASCSSDGHRERDRAVHFVDHQQF